MLRQESKATTTTIDLRLSRGREQRDCDGAQAERKEKVLERHKIVGRFSTVAAASNFFE